MKVPKLKYAVGSVAQKAAEGSESLLAEARKDVVAARSPEPAVDEATSDMAEAVSKVDASESVEAGESEENLEQASELVESFSFAGNAKLNKQFVMENLSQVADSPVSSTKEGIVDFITSLHRKHVAEEKQPLLAPEDFKKLEDFAKDEPIAPEETEEREEMAEGGEVHEHEREEMAHGGSLLIVKKPLDTYDNIRPEEKAAVKASQKPDEEMEKNYSEFIIKESLDTDEQEHLKEALEKDSELNSIFDKIMDVAGEFSGEGEVKGPGTGTSDSIPARLSDGEFVFTRKATDQIGVEKLQAMMDDAEREADGSREGKAYGGIVTNPLQTEKKQDGIMYKTTTEEEIKKQMISANRTPSLFTTR
jgi:hypothetical protein